MAKSRVPKFFWLDEKLEYANISELLEVLKSSEAQVLAKQKIWELTTMLPEKRLAINCMTIIRLLSEKPVKKVLVDGITKEERRILFELEDLEFSDRHLMTVHLLMNLKERYFMMKAMRDCFRRSREDNTHITLF